MNNGCMEEECCSYCNYTGKIFLAIKVHVKNQMLFFGINLDIHGKVMHIIYFDLHMKSRKIFW